MQGRYIQAFRRYSASSAFGVRNAQRNARDAADSIAERLASSQEACSSVADRLDQETRQRLLVALVAAESRRCQDRELGKAYLDGLFKEYDTAKPFGQLDRSEFEAAIAADRELLASMSAAQSSPEGVSNLSIALASSIPFIGMGAVDNAIMLVAGSEIDTLFGAKLGLSTLAAAGLGNMISDVAGVSMANRIENMTRNMPWLNEKAYQAGCTSKSGQVGCLLGMAPLLFMDTHEHHDDKASKD